MRAFMSRVAIVSTFCGAYSCAVRRTLLRTSHCGQQREGRFIRRVL